MGASLTAKALARAMGVPVQTVLRWLRVWRDLRVEGIALVPSKGRYGARYVIDRSVVDRWRSGLLPEPFQSQAAA
jgi:hypothetical protein